VVLAATSRLGKQAAQRELCLADRELDMLRDALRGHVKALAVDIGPRTPSTADSLERGRELHHFGV